MKKYISCSHFGPCSGCQIDLQQPCPLWPEVSNFFQELGLFPSLYEGPRTEWRCRAKLAVRGSVAYPLIGLFKEGTHEVMPIPFCQVHHPQINKAVELVKQWMVKYHITPYDELTGKGELRYLQFVVERSTGCIQLSLVLNFPDLSHPRVKELVGLLHQWGEKDKGQFWHSIWINLNSKQTNTIFGPIWHLCYGQELLWEAFAPIAVCYQPASFAQANLNLFEQMLNCLKTHIEDGAKLVEYYAGVGVIGLFVVDKCSWVRCVELNPHAEFCFERSKERLPQQEAIKITFHTGAAQHLLILLEGAETIIVDPPRKGLDSALMNKINRTDSLKQLLYVSCGWPAFKRDCQELLQAGWQLKHAEGYYFFPGSPHIEILAEFKR